ncbi:MAG: CoA activase [Desulfobacterales bacterium]|nr:CoA activase [Desulfobacterales bacterium]MCP4163814.1 CoA activase [Deltaproteobacteria bacterium]
MDTKNLLGIDIGSVAISAVEMNEKKEILQSEYLIHHGDIEQSIEQVFKKFDNNSIGAIAATNSTPSLINATKKYDNNVSLIAAAKLLHTDFRYILSVGGEKFGLLSFDTEGEYMNFRSNTSCAAGTGSFLDQQSGRLNLMDIKDLSETATNNTGSIPKIASRCAVFAKTDLIHAQQEGFSLAEICDGLCFGLSKNINDTLFPGIKPEGKIVFCGGVSKNTAVVNHMKDLTETELEVHEHANLFGAIGAAVCMIDEANGEFASVPDLLEIKNEKEKEKQHSYDPLTLELSDYPDFKGLENYLFVGEDENNPVEVDIYEPLETSKSYNLYLGIDIGSTSSKAVLTNKNRTVIAGFYTRTAGNPLNAVLNIYRSIDDITERKSLEFNIIGSGTTGSGRKFIGKIIGADTIVDEITAHASAATELNSEVDTIIEIGGQDAKFTTLSNGMVTSSIMNNVCAAGTGSFLEEQAKKLGINIRQYSERTENIKAPLVSDRCTVFMERDINHLLSEGYTVNEVLASALHSVRENYLIKVASEANIGNKIFFQGATAKIRALVAAFEQRLQKPILVSKFCHLTGALGTAIIVSEELNEKTSFKGTSLYKETIPIYTEVCEICNNNCKIKIAEVRGEKVAYGFLCGRDYEDQRFVSTGTNKFDIINKRNKLFKKPKTDKKDFTIGIPAAMHVYEDIPFWERFFEVLDVKVITGEKAKGSIKKGKYISGAEFCAPVSAMHGQIDYLREKSDYIFLPFYIQEKTKDLKKQYCYYTQYIPSLVAKIGEGKCLTPLVKYLYTNFHSKMQIYKSLKKITQKSFSFFEVSAAFEKACELKETLDKKYKDLYLDEKSDDDINVVLLGRPYSILSKEMNSGIPDIFAKLSVKTFFQDMVPDSENALENISKVSKNIPWSYAKKIIDTAEIIASTKGVYPVFVTSFKCTPDAFILETFKKVMAENNKPYLILELDEHDSSVGYETRIEAAVRSFRNDYSTGGAYKLSEYKSLILENDTDIRNKTLIIPNWDSITCRLLVATLRREGIDAILINETEDTIKRSLKFNTGQCIPVNSIIQGFVDTVKEHNLDPSKSILWMSDSRICNLAFYPSYIKNLLSSYGDGMENAGIYVGEISYIEISVRAAISAYFSYMFGGMLRKMGCKIRPYEIHKGTTDRVINKSLEVLEKAFLGELSREDAVSQVVSNFEWIDIKKTDRPKVAVFGDIYVRDNDAMNQDVTHFIEDNGGELLTTPYTEIGKMIVGSYFRRWINERAYFDIISYKALFSTMTILEKKYMKLFNRVIQEPNFSYAESPEKILSNFDIITENSGESMENVLKIYYLKKHHPELSLFIQLNPAFCCPSLVTEAMVADIEKLTETPVVSVTYDGTGGIKNESIIPYLKYPRKNKEIDKERKFS